MRATTDKRAGGRNAALRRYPALGFLGLAALLAVALPSALTVPYAGPPTLAEVAPVPGQGSGSGGDIGRLGAGSSDGLGDGIGPDGVPPEGALDPGTPGSTLKRCVGSPPRQTEDPLSPPCVAFFEGDNGGDTSRGVTRDEVRVVILNHPALVGSNVPEGTVVDYAEPPSPEDNDRDFWLKVLARYFNERYQTYGRRVHLYGLYGQGGSGPSPDRRRAEAARVDTEFRPFATGTLTFNTIVPYLREATSRGMIAVAIDGFSRPLYRSSSPLLWSVFPDLEDEAALVSGYVCRRLAGRAARYSGNPADLTRERRFGILYTSSEREPENAALAHLIETGLASCGLEAAPSIGISDATEQAQAQSLEAVAQMRAAGVTTVITAARASTVLAFTTSASGAGWFPEWLVPGRRTSAGVDQAGSARLLPQEQWQHAFGVSFSARWGDVTRMHWARSYQETCGGCPLRGPYYYGAYAYDLLQTLFYGIQAAGPRLTPANFAKGMHAIPARRAPDPYTPAAYFASGNYSFIKDAMEIWWDPSGRAPGSEGQAGCYRLPRDGRRFRASEWPRGDDGLFTDGPCNGDSPPG